MHAIREGPMGEHQESAMLPTPLLGFQDGSIYQLPSANSSIQAGNSQRPTREPRSQTDGISPSRKGESLAVPGELALVQFQGVQLNLHCRPEIRQTDLCSFLLVGFLLAKPRFGL